MALPLTRALWQAQLEELRRQESIVNAMPCCASEDEVQTSHAGLCISSAEARLCQNRSTCVAAQQPSENEAD
jgi:hypothetical protein